MAEESLCQDGLNRNRGIGIVSEKRALAYFFGSQLPDEAVVSVHSELDPNRVVR